MAYIPRGSDKFEAENLGWMTGNAPAASWTTTRRSTIELHPPLPTIIPEPRYRFKLVILRQ